MFDEHIFLGCKMLTFKRIQDCRSNYEVHKTNELRNTIIQILYLMLDDTECFQGTLFDRERRKTSVRHGIRRQRSGKHCFLC